MKKLRVGILGCANIVEKYAIGALQALPEVLLVAIASRNKNKADEWARRYDLDAESYESLIARADIDVIYSPLPIGLQEEWVLKAAKQKKHVICEKSLTSSLESAQRMVGTCKRQGVALYENFVPEFHPQHAQVLSMIHEGAIGSTKVFSGRYGFPPFPEGDIRYSAELKGGSLNDAGCYTVFMARKILGEEPHAVTCSLFNNKSEVDTEGSALVEFSTATALVSFGFNNLYQNSYSVWGSKGLIHVPRAFAIPPTMSPRIELVTNDGVQENTETIIVQETNQFWESFNYFCRAVSLNDHQTFDVMYTNILNQAKLMEAMRVSAQGGVRVKLSDI